MKKFLIACAVAALLSGCGSIDRADPSARSARATYGAITITVTDSSTCNFTLGDGALAAADGNGGISQPSTMTTTVSPQFTTPAGFDPVSMGINGIVTLAGNGIDLYGVKLQADAAKQNQQQNQNGACPDGNCGDCSDGSCGPCADGKCGTCENCML